MFKRKNTDPPKVAEAEIDRLRQRRQEIAARLAASDAEKATALAVQSRAPLFEDDLDGAAAARAEADALAAVTRHARWERALTDIDGEIEKAEANLASLRTAIAADSAEKDLRSRAGAVDTKIDALVVQAENLVTGFGDLRDELAASGIATTLPGGTPSRPSTPPRPSSCTSC